METNLKKYKKIIDKIRSLGFNNFYQAGVPSKYHELNLIIEDNENDIQYWICKSFGNYHIIYRNGINNSKGTQHRYDCEKTLKSVCEKFEEVVLMNKNF